MEENNPAIINSLDQDQNTCLHWAADRESTKFLKFLSAKYENQNFNVNFQNKFGETALHLANEEEIFNLLIQDFGVDPSIRDKDGELAEV